MIYTFKVNANLNTEHTNSAGDKNTCCYLHEKLPIFPQFTIQHIWCVWYGWADYKRLGKQCAVMCIGHEHKTVSRRRKKYWIGKHNRNIHGLTLDQQLSWDKYAHTKFKRKTDKCIKLQSKVSLLVSHLIPSAAWSINCSEDNNG